mmetsp:Transcript_8587/g.10020  ORF Transcript_8587/g.10020 Transcript_8587/m.10020 type:complete len:159 (+) Transcript_8587:214-690(+)
MREVSGRDNNFVQQLSLTDGIVAHEEKSELIYFNDVVPGLCSASKSARNPHNWASPSEERTELYCHDRDSCSMVLPKFVSKKPTPTTDFTLMEGKAYECAEERKQHVQDDYATERSLPNISDSYNSSNSLFTSSIPILHLSDNVNTVLHFSDTINDMS